MFKWYQQKTEYVYLHSILTFWKIGSVDTVLPSLLMHVHYYRDVLVRVQDHSSLNSQDQEAKRQTRVVQVQLPGLHLHHSALVWHYFTTAVPLCFFFFFWEFHIQNLGLSKFIPNRMSGISACPENIQESQATSVHSHTMQL